MKNIQIEAQCGILNMFDGNAKSVVIFNGAIGKTIAAISLGNDDALHFVFDDGSKMQMFDAGQSCCEVRYMRTDDDLDYYVGSKIVGATIKEAPSITGPWVEHDVEFLEVQTDKGVFTMASHNEHNGYYGGFCIRAAAE